MPEAIFTGQVIRAMTISSAAPPKKERMEEPTRPIRMQDHSGSEAPR